MLETLKKFQIVDKVGDNVKKNVMKVELYIFIHSI